MHQDEGINVNDLVYFKHTEYVAPYIQLIQLGVIKLTAHEFKYR